MIILVFDVKLCIFHDYSCIWC